MGNEALGRVYSPPSTHVIRPTFGIAQNLGNTREVGVPLLRFRWKVDREDAKGATWRSGKSAVASPIVMGFR